MEQELRVACPGAQGSTARIGAVAFIHRFGSLLSDGLGDEALLDQQILLHFSPGVPEHHAVRFLGGLMQAAPELVLRLPSLLQRLDALIADWAPEDFVAHLPDLRFAFTRLKPQESAETIVAFHGYGPAEAAALQSWHAEVSEAEMLQGSRLQHVLAQELQRDGLEHGAGSRRTCYDQPAERGIAGCRVRRSQGLTAYVKDV